MTEKVRPWAPLGLAASLALRDRIEQAVEDWSQDWFVRFRLTIGRSEIVPGDPWAGVDGLREQGRALGLARSERATLRLYERAFDADLTSTPLAEADKRVVEDFARQLLDDLVSRIERSLGLTGDADLSPGLAGGIKIGLVDEAGAVLIWLVAPFWAIVSFCRLALPQPRNARAPLQPRATAVAGHRLMLEAVLGSAELTIGDLKTLAPGDVLVLDRALSEPAELRDPRTSRAVLVGDLTPLDDDMALRLRSA